MGNTRPRVSIGLPVYNGENYLEEALDSLLSQTFREFELIISDNASTDKTQDICTAYAAKDTRIRYYRQAQNLGAARNYNFVFEEASADYFKWAAHDDLCAPQFLERCVAALDQDPSAVLSYPLTKIMYLAEDPLEGGAGAPGFVSTPADTQGLVPPKYLGQYETVYENGAAILYYDLKLDVDSPQPHRRFFDLIQVPHECFPIFGVIRTAVLKETQLIGSFSSSDRTLLAELSLHGRFYEVPEYLFIRRIHPKSSCNAFKGRRSRMAWFDPGHTGKLVFPNWRVLTEYSKSVKNAPLGPNDRLNCYGNLTRYARLQWKRLAMDFVKIIKGLP